MEEWNLMEPPRLKDEHDYDIELKNGKIIKNVEYWAFAGKFMIGGSHPEHIDGKDVFRWKAL